jgi:hypothetical protein
MVHHALDRGYDVVGVCREQRVRKLEASRGASPLFWGRRTNPRSSSKRLQGVTSSHHIGTLGGSALLVRNSLDYAQPEVRLIFSCGWYITSDGKDVSPPSFQREEKLTRWLGRLTRIVDIDDQVEASRWIFASGTR